MAHAVDRRRGGARQPAGRVDARARHKLALEGLLDTIPRAGCIVAEMSDHDFPDLFNIRMAIEQLAARRALTSPPRRSRPSRRTSSGPTAPSAPGARKR
jgi:hypothetical protein